MKLYRISNWSKIYENNRTRELRQLAWVPVPNNHDGDGYTIMVSRPNGAAIFGAWIGCVQVASRCDPRGTLLRRSAVPHNSDSLSRITRLEAKWFDQVFRVAVDECKWMTVEDFQTIPQACATIPHRTEVILTGTEQKGTEQKGTEHLLSPNGDEVVMTQARVVIQLLNEQTGRHFRELASNLTVIAARLKEPQVDLQGIKEMIIRQCKRWKGTSQEEYLRPETLFGKTKFDSYYAAKDLPITYGNSNNGTGEKPNPRNQHTCADKTDYGAVVARRQTERMAPKVGGPGQSSPPAASGAGTASF